MLHQISWLTYVVSIVCLSSAYYGYVIITYYRQEILLTFYRVTGKQTSLNVPGSGDFQIPYDVMAKARPDEVGFVSQDELTFAFSEIDDEPNEEELSPDLVEAAAPSRLISSFSELIAEIKTLIRVINESSESKENFEMLFCLIIQKYPELAATRYQEQVNEFLLSEGAPQFPFELNIDELQGYWNSQLKNFQN